MRELGSMADVGDDWSLILAEWTIMGWIRLKISVEVRWVTECMQAGELKLVGRNTPPVEDDTATNDGGASRTGGINYGFEAAAGCEHVFDYEDAFAGNQPVKAAG